VIRDILHRISDRWPCRVVVWPVVVQGEGAAWQVRAAIDGFGRLPPGGRIPRPDVLIVARGGGSLEDLWSFNEEIVARAAAASAIPLISAVGHETDFTLIDFAADRRAPTPTAAAEMAVPVRGELIAAVADLGARQLGATARRIEAARKELRAAARALPRPEDLLAIPRRRLDELAGRIGKALIANTVSHHRALDRAKAGLVPANLATLIVRGRSRLSSLSDRADKAAARRIERRRAGVEAQGKLLEALSYRSVLNRGFALVSSGDGLVRSASAVTPGLPLRLTFTDGSADAVGASGEARPKAAKPARSPGSQGSLF
jgi:exodeoxyribonuclease VII large subunit